MLNISQQIYVGWDATQVYKDLPEAEIIPLGESTQEKKKLDKFVIKHTNLTEYDNVPLPGFTLYQVGKKNYSSTDSSWLVIDPRGFLARITQSNMETILKVTGITEGLIQQRCVWARNDSDVTLSLVPVSSDLYNEAVQNTSLIESRVKIADVSIGDTVLLQNKMQGIYLGVHSLYCTMRTHMNGSEFKVQALLRKQVVEISPNKFYYHTDAKILKIVKKCSAPLTRQAAADYLNHEICINPATFFTPYDVLRGTYYGSEGRVKFVSTHAAPKIKITLEEIDQQEAELTFNQNILHSDNGCLVVEDANGKKFLTKYPWWGSSMPVSANNFHTREIISISEDRMSIVNSKDSVNVYNTWSLDNFKKFYKIVKSVKNNTYI